MPTRRRERLYSTSSPGAVDFFLMGGLHSDGPAVPRGTRATAKRENAVFGGRPRSVRAVERVRVPQSLRPPARASGNKDC